MNKNTFGAIDLGSNSLQMVLGRKEGETLTIFRRELREPRLGEGLQPGGNLIPPAKERTRQALFSLLEIIRDEQIETGIIAATSALREAADGKQFLDEIAAISPFPVRLLSGEEEAYYGFRGVIACSTEQINEEDAIVLDIGGRSTELSWREQGKVCGCSMLTGAVKMQELFQLSLENGDDTPLKDYVKKVLTEQARAASKQAGLFPPKKKLLLGVGGTITTLSALSQNLTQYNPQKIHGYTLLRTEIQKHQHLLLTSTIEERRHLLPFAPARADIIPAAATILLTTMEYLEYDNLTTSEGGVLTGLLAELSGCKMIRL